METITSAELGRFLDVDASQVRKDFAAVGLSGMSRVGYDVCEVCRTIRRELGFDESYRAVLVGTGHLGAAILNYEGFERFGLNIVAAFDSDLGVVGDREGGLTIQSVHQLKPYIQEHRIPLAVLTTPGPVTQGVADLVVLGGVRAIWNFSPVRLTVPSSVLVRNEHISVGLAEISYHLRTQSEAAPEGSEEADLNVGESGAGATSETVGAASASLHGA